MARTNSDETGLLTRCVPERLKHSALYRWLLRLTRVLQFLSAAISLGIFSSRLYKIYRLVNSIKTRRGVNGAFGAVEGILAAAVVYTIIATLMSCILKGKGPRWLRWLWVLLDLLFVGGFIAVAVLTSPNGGMAGPKHCYDDRDATNTSNLTGNTTTGDDTCDLPWGTFILAIIST
jgi:MFS family permease